MKRTLAISAAAAGLCLTGVAAHASCADPRTATTAQGTAGLMAPLHQPQTPGLGNAIKENPADAVVGTWHVAYTAGGAPFAQAFIQWHSDGTEWENIDQPTLSGNICLGSWKKIDRSHVYRNHYGWLFTNGIVSGYFNETETDEVGRDGNSYTGTNTTIIYDLTGNQLMEIPGTSAATRIAP